MITALLTLPLIAGLAAFIIKDDATRRRLLLWTAAGHLALTAMLFLSKLNPKFAFLTAPSGEWFGLDELGLIFLGVTSVLFLGSAVYAVHYLALEKRDPGVYEKL